MRTGDGSRAAADVLEKEVVMGKEAAGSSAGGSSTKLSEWETCCGSGKSSSGIVPFSSTWAGTMYSWL